MLLFAVVIALVLLSYFVQQRRDNSEMDSFRMEHNSRLGRTEQSLEDAENRLAALEERLGELEVVQRLLREELAARDLQSGTDKENFLRRFTELEQELETLGSNITEQVEENGNSEEIKNNA